jgi:AraC-like DNA-binding protein
MILEAINLKALVKIITLHTFFLALLMTAGLLLTIRKNYKNRIFFGLFLAFSLIIFYFFLYESKLETAHPYLSAISMSGVFLLGPMLYFLARYAVNKSFLITKKHIWHLIPFPLSVLLGSVSVYYLGVKPIKINPDYYGNIITIFLGFTGSLSFMTYLILTGKILIQNFVLRFSTIKNEPPAVASFVLFDMFLAASVSDFLTIPTSNPVFTEIAILLISICVILLFIINLVYPNFQKSISDVIVKEKQRRSYLSNIDTEKLKTKINDLISIQEIYTDEHLTLKKLAALTDVSTHQLSEFINEHYQKNYTTFINEYRINKAKILLTENGNETILAIAYDVGFHSKSAFNEAFRKITGLTPTEYKSHKQKNMS